MGHLGTIQAYGGRFRSFWVYSQSSCSSSFFIKSRVQRKMTSFLSSVTPKPDISSEILEDVVNFLIGQNSRIKVKFLQLQKKYEVNSSEIYFLNSSSNFHTNLPRSLMHLSGHQKPSVVVLTLSVLLDIPLPSWTPAHGTSRHLLRVAECEFYFSPA